MTEPTMTPEDRAEQEVNRLRVVLRSFALSGPPIPEDVIESIAGKRLTKALTHSFREAEQAARDDGLEGLDKIENEMNGVIQPDQNWSLSYKDATARWLAALLVIRARKDEK